MTHRSSDPGVDENDGAHESTVIDKTNALLRKMERGETLNLAKELADLAMANPEAPTIIARMLGDKDIRNPAPLAEVLAAFCDGRYFPGKRILKDNAGQIDDELWPLITNPETPAFRKILAADKHLEEWFSALESMENPRSAWCLNALAEWPMPEALRDRMDRECRPTNAFFLPMTS